MRNQQLQISIQIGILKSIIIYRKKHNCFVVKQRRSNMRFLDLARFIPPFCLNGAFLGEGDLLETLRSEVPGCASISDYPVPRPLSPALANKSLHWPRIDWRASQGKTHTRTWKEKKASIKLAQKHGTLFQISSISYAL